MKKGYSSLVLWIRSTAPTNPIIMIAGRNLDGNSGIGKSVQTLSTLPKSMPVTYYPAGIDIL
jgi:hypothetical protein